MTAKTIVVCAVCGAPQFQTPSGPTCVNGHGGADAAIKTFSDPMTKQERQWVDRNLPKCACGHGLARDRLERGVNECPRCEPPDPTEHVLVSRDDLQSLLDDARETYLTEPDYVQRIAAALEE